MGVNDKKILTRTGPVKNLRRRLYNTLYKQMADPQKRFCPLCGVAMWSHRWGDKKRRNEYLHRASVDHIIPKSKGGRTRPNNLRIICQGCNEAKSDTMPADWPSAPHPTAPTGKKESPHEQDTGQDHRQQGAQQQH